jgi:3-oxoisoapionate decarboxylase
VNRREMLLACAAPAVSALAVDLPARSMQSKMGVVIHSYPNRQAADRDSKTPPLSDPLTFIEHCHKIGAGGAQLGIGKRDADYVRKLRERLEATGLFLEGSIALPRERDDVERFAAEVRTAKEIGVSVLRTVMMPGRRYENFATAESFRETASKARQSLVLAEPVVAKADLRLAIENHKDWLTFELLEIVQRISSKHVGVTIDTGNSIALLEEPMTVVEACAPWAYSVHIKDMGVQEYGDGFLLSEVPFGTGFLDLKKMVATIRKARPEVRFNVEMITRDPLKVPCLSESYWATLDKLPGKQLAAALAMVRKHAAKQPLPKVSGLATEKRLEVEEQNVRLCLDYGRQHLGL